MSIFRKLGQTLRIGKSRYTVGHDLAGNTYLEQPSLSGSLDPRHTRRSIEWKQKKQLGDYDQRSIPVQWVMWLRHTRTEPPSIEELVRDRERIRTTQANAARLALEDEHRRHKEQAGSGEGVVRGEVAVARSEMLKSPLDAFVPMPTQRK